MGIGLPLDKTLENILLLGLAAHAENALFYLTATHLYTFPRLIKDTAAARADFLMGNITAGIVKKKHKHFLRIINLSNIFFRFKIVFKMKSRDKSTRQDTEFIRDKIRCYSPHQDTVLYTQIYTSLYTLHFTLSHET